MIGTVEQNTVMTHDQRAEFFKEFLKRCKSITDKKGVDYAQGHDQPANANFGRAADRTKGRLDKYDILFVYWQKHLQSLEGWFATRKLESEPIAERIKDNINYMLIFASMLEEDGILDGVIREKKDPKPEDWYGGASADNAGGCVVSSESIRTSEAR